MARQSLLVNQQHSHREVFYFLWLSLKPVIMSERRWKNPSELIIIIVVTQKWWIHCLLDIISSFFFASPLQPQTLQLASNEINARCREWSRRRWSRRRHDNRKEKNDSTQSRQCCWHAADMRNDMRSYLWCRYMWWFPITFVRRWHRTSTAAIGETFDLKWLGCFQECGQLVLRDVDFTTIHVVHHGAELLELDILENEDWMFIVLLR